MNIISQATGCCENPLWSDDGTTAPDVIIKRIIKVNERQPWELAVGHRLASANIWISPGAIGFTTNASTYLYLCDENFNF